ncbi:hypothetical protein PV783_13620 [Chitinophaga sp. CC14]|uniref:hypothetical protein n=1 Tax=Chitinophaga sp. CC14 TaxID=3029199 RepID=UPI003B7A194C
MKKIKTLLLAASALIGIGTAYGSKPHFNGTTYYAVTDGAGGFVWTNIHPDIDIYACLPFFFSYCTIHTINGYSPIANVEPTASQATPTNTKHAIYIHIHI